MAYRFTASGTLELPDRYIETVCGIFDSRRIGFVRQGNQLQIKHDEKAATPSAVSAEVAFADAAPFVQRPQAIQAWSELTGDYEIGFIDGKLRRDESVHLWSRQETVPTPEQLVTTLRQRGIAAQSHAQRTSRKSSRRARIFTITPGSGGPGCQVTIKRRFWDSYDLLSVPDVYRPLCRKYHLTPAALRTALHEATFGMEVRRPALGNASSTLIYDALVDIIEDIIEGIRTDIG